MIRYTYTYNRNFGVFSGAAVEWYVVKNDGAGTFDPMVVAITSSKSLAISIASGLASQETETI